MRALILDHSDNSTVMRKRNIRMLSRFAVGIAKCQLLKSPPSARCCRVRRLLATDCTKEQLVRPLPSEMTSSSLSAWQHPRTSTFARCSWRPQAEAWSTSWMLLRHPLMPGRRMRRMQRARRRRRRGDPGIASWTLLRGSVSTRDSSGHFAGEGLPRSDRRTQRTLRAAMRA